MRMQSLIALAALVWPAAGAAQISGPQRCDQAGVDLRDVAVGEDLSGVRSFYQGNVTLFELDTVEPACCSTGLAIVMPAAPNADEPVGMACWAIKGLAGVDLRAARSRYDPRSGLTLTIPTQSYDPETGGTVAGAPLRLRIDSRRGTISDLGRR